MELWGSALHNRSIGLQRLVRAWFRQRIDNNNISSRTKHHSSSILTNRFLRAPREKIVAIYQKRSIFTAEQTTQLVLHAYSTNLYLVVLKFVKNHVLGFFFIKNIDTILYKILNLINS